MDWTETAIWWSVYPLGACGAPIRTSDPNPPGHRMRRLLNWLDYLIELGANGLALGPIWRSETHGYDVTDHFRIDPRLGDLADFDQLITACHERGIRVLLDGVFNHVGVHHPDFQAALAGGKQATWFAKDATQPDGFARFEGHAGLVEYDHSNPEVAALVEQIMAYWLERGADGWRLDAAYRMEPGFWAPISTALRQRYPDCCTVGEVLHGDYSSYAAQSQLTSLTQYELWKALWSSLKDRNPHELSWCLQRHIPMLEDFTPWVFVGNHDVTRICSQISPHDALIAFALALTLGGMPAIYYGDEVGWTGIKTDGVGGDDAIRPPLDDSPPTLDAAAAEQLRQHQLLIGLRRKRGWLFRPVISLVELTETRLTYRCSHHDEWIDVQLSFEDEQAWLQICDATGIVYEL